MKSILIKNANVINEGSIEIKDVLVVDGKIDKIGKIGESLTENADTTIDATGKYLMPGIIDDQVHFREPGLTHKAEIYTEAGLPDGVFNVVSGLGPVGQMLAEHEGIEKISLTGSVPTGKRVMESASKTLKHVTLELGGKSPLIVFDDANLDNAVSAAMLANFYTQGEICSNGTRVYVHKDIKDTFLEKLIERTSKMIIGDPMDLETHVG